MTTPTTYITVFGALEISHPPAAPLRPPTQRVLALLGYLIVHHDLPQSREKLVDQLWPDLPPRQGRRMLSDTLWRARRTLSSDQQPELDQIVIAGDAVTFRSDPRSWVDLIAFEQHLRQAEEATDATALRAAIELYRGDLLEDCYDDWVLYARERLRAQHLSALQRLLAHDQAEGRYDQALQSALRLVQADPLREAAHRALMQLYHLLGRTDEALRAFGQCRAVLAAELGLEPEAETLSLYEELNALQQRRAETLSAAILQDVPLVGRADARAELMEAIEQTLHGAGGMLLVTGAAGQGKSRLLRESAAGASWRGAQISWGRAREDAQAEPLGVLREAVLAALTPLRARQLAALLPAHTLTTLLPLLPELGELLPEQTPAAALSSEQPAAKLYAALTSVVLGLGQLAPQVLILEDLHWFDPATLEALAAMLPALRDARVLLILSGRSEELAGRALVWQALLQLDRTGLMRRIDLPGLSAAEAADLVRRALRMHHSAPRFSGRLAEATGGNPFFILETLRALHAQGTLTRDAQGTWHTPWDTPSSDYQELPLPQGLRDAIGGRLRRLPPPERDALAAAAVLGQNFSPTVLARMTGATSPPDPAPASWPSVADQLLRRQFLAEDSDGYRFEHGLLREVIYDHLDSSTRQTLHLRAAEALEQEHYARVEALAQHLYLAAAWDKAAPYLLQAGDHACAVCAYRDALRNYDQALEALAHQGAEAAQVAALWDLQLKRGAVATSLGDYAIAIAAFEDALRLADQDAFAADAPQRQGARRSAQVQALNGLSVIYGLRNEYAQALGAIEQAMTHAQASPRTIDRAHVLYQAGLVSFRRDDYAEARRFLNEAFQLYEMLGLDADCAKCLSRIGISYLRQHGSTDQVIEYLTRAREIYRRQGDRFAEHSCLGDIGSAYLLGGRLREAAQSIEPCLDFFRAIGALDDISACLCLCGEAYRRMGRLDDALAALREAWAICKRLDRSAAADFSEVCIAATLRDMGQTDEALATLARALQTADRMIRMRALLVAADIRRLQGRSREAWAYMEQGQALASQIGSKAWLGIAHRLRGQLTHADADGAQAARCSLDESIRLLREAHSDDELALSYLAYSQSVAQQRPAEARSALIQAQSLALHCGMDGTLERIQQLIQALPAASLALQPGQQRVMLARRGVPRGRPLREDELIEVIWTIAETEQREVGHGADKTGARQSRLMRLWAEANAQGAEPTVGDFAAALGVTPRTIDRDIAALRASGATLATRGSS